MTTISDVRMAEEAGFLPMEIAYMFDQDIGPEIEAPSPLDVSVRSLGGRARSGW